MSRRRAVITGIGPITCMVRGRKAFWNGILAEENAGSAASLPLIRIHFRSVARARF